MFYENELQFLCDTFRKSRVRALATTPAELSALLSGIDFDSNQSTFLSEKYTVSEIFRHLEPRTMYKSTDRFKRCYIYLLVPKKEATTVLFIGPYFSSPVSPREILEIGEKNQISPKNQRYLDKYYSTIPVIPESSHLFVMLDTFCERLWDSPSFAITEHTSDQAPLEFAINEGTSDDSFDDTLLNMRAMESRYSFENEIIEAVSLGQIHKEKRLFSAFSENLFEKRSADPLQNAKNYCIIMNTLLRKAAESGGVHPVYIDKVSSEFALKIERLSSLSENAPLMREMFGTYCRLVRKHSLKKFSLVVQRTILIINTDLSANLSLSSLAEKQNVSPGYLSTIFSKETGKTLSEYIRERRIKHAAHLLSTTHLQVQTIALHCGIMDVQYFSKIFKKQMGKTPKEYREDMKQS